MQYILVKNPLHKFPQAQLFIE